MFRAKQMSHAFFLSVAIVGGFAYADDVPDLNVDPVAFANRVAKLSLGFRDVLKLPDVIGVEEIGRAHV